MKPPKLIHKRRNNQVLQLLSFQFERIMKLFTKTLIPLEKHWCRSHFFRPQPATLLKRESGTGVFL